MAKVVINNTDSPKDSRVPINNNFTELYTGQEIVQASEKTTPVDADTVGLIDSAASSVLKYVTWANIKSALNPMTTGGDLVYGGTSGVETRLANGTEGQVLQSNGTTLAPSWAAPAADFLVMQVFS